MSPLMLMDEHFALLPNDLKTLHHRHLNLRLDNQTEVITQKLIKEWSSHFGEFLNQRRSVIETNLFHLFDAYRTGHLKNCLEIINKFHKFPGYPFITKGSFAEHINYICNYLERINKKNVPKVPFFAFHKTASSFISVVVCRLFDVSPTVLSFDHLISMPAWVNAFRKWGGVIHDHYFPSQPNLKLLYKAGIKKCVVHNRNPIDTLISFAFHMVNLNFKTDKDKLLDEAFYISLVRDYLENEMESFLHYYGVWSHAWKREILAKRMKILETSYEEMKSDLFSYFKRILNFYNVNYEKQELKSILQELSLDKTSYNFRKGSNVQWEEILTAAQIKKAKQIIQREFPSLEY